MRQLNGKHRSNSSRGSYRPPRSNRKIKNKVSKSNGYSNRRGGDSPRTDALEELKREMTEAGIGLDIASGLEGYKFEKTSAPKNVSPVDDLAPGSESPNAMTYNLRQQIYLLEMECAVLRQQQVGGAIPSDISMNVHSVESVSVVQEEKKVETKNVDKTETSWEEEETEPPTMPSFSEPSQHSNSLPPVNIPSASFKVPKMPSTLVPIPDTREKAPGASVSLGKTLADVQAAYDRARLEQRDDRLKMEKKVRDQVILVQAQNEQLSLWEARLEAHKEDMLRREQSLEKRLKEKTHGNIASRKRAQALETQMSAVQSELSSATSRLEEAHADHSTKLRKAHATIKQFELDLNVAKKQVDEIGDKHSEVHAKHSTIKDKLLTTESILTDTSNKLTNTISALHKAEIEKRQAVKKMEQFEALATKAQEDCSELVKTNVELEKKNNELTDKLKSTLDKHDDLGKRHNNSAMNKVALAEITAAFRVSRDAQTNMEVQHATAQEENALLRRRVDEAEQQTRDYREQCSTLDRENTELHTKHRTAQTNAERFEVAEQNCRRKLAQAEKRILVLEADASLLRQEVQKVRKLQSLPLDRFKHLQESNMANVEMLEKLMEVIQKPTEAI